MDQCHLKVCAQKDSTNELDKTVQKIVEKSPMVNCDSDIGQ